MTIEPVPANITQMVTNWIDEHIRQAEKYSNMPFKITSSGAYDLLRLAGKIYALGFEAGFAVGDLERSYRERLNAEQGETS